MIWHVVCRVGERDVFSPPLKNKREKIIDLPFSNKALGGYKNVRESVIASIEGKYSVKLSGVVHDFLYASMSAYAADISLPRCVTKDRWSRDFILHVPVFNSHLWREASPIFEESLNFLTGDNWTISTRERFENQPEASISVEAAFPGTVCLLSGGLDSLIGAIDLLKDGTSIAFVSHYGGGMTSRFQENVYSALKTYYRGQCLKNKFFVSPPRFGKKENSMRSRSILFLALGVAVASAMGKSVPLVVPENGLISLNIPLTRTRVGSSSTRTTHPYFISCVQQVLEKLGILNKIQMPYKHSTKGEMLINVCNKKILNDMLSLTMSCSHPEVARYIRKSPNMHCGYCLPCLIRRAAVNAAELCEVDSLYAYDVRNEQLTRGRAKDIRALKIALARETAKRTSQTFRVLQSGPLPPNEVSKFADVYHRGLMELSAFLEGEL